MHNGISAASFAAQVPDLGGIMVLGLRAAAFAAGLAWCVFATAGFAEETAESDAEDTKASADVSLTYGFKPGFDPAVGNGSYLEGGLAFGLQWHAVSFEFAQEVGREYAPDASTEARDPRLTLSRKIPIDPENLALSLDLSVNASPGASRASREIFYYGSAGGSVGLSRKFARLRLGVTASGSKKAYRYTMNSDGVPNATGSKALAFSASLSVTDELSLGGRVRYAESFRHEGAAPKFSYENSARVSYQLSGALSVEAGVSTTDAQLEPDGAANDEFRFYQAYKTEMYLSADYAL